MPSNEPLIYLLEPLGENDNTSNSKETFRKDGRRYLFGQADLWALSHYNMLTAKIYTIT